MTHTQQPSIDLIPRESVLSILQELERGDIHISIAMNYIKALPQEPTTDNLLDEMPDTFMNLSRMRDGTRDWHAMASNKEWLNTTSGYGTSPKLALLALKEKLKIT